MNGVTWWKKQRQLEQVHKNPLKYTQTTEADSISYHETVQRTQTHTTHSVERMEQYPYDS